MIIRFLLTLIIAGCTQVAEKIEVLETQTVETIPTEYIADGFDYPVGKPNSKGYYNAQPFGKNTHLGDDWNGLGGGDTDLGDPIFTTAHGKVVYAENFGGAWGNVLRIVHFLPDSTKVESLYAHCDEIMTAAGKWVKRGEQIGTIGNNNGGYPAHLHFEMRDDITLPVGKGYSSDQKGYLNPTAFIKKHRNL